MIPAPLALRALLIVLHVSQIQLYARIVQMDRNVYNVTVIRSLTLSKASVSVHQLQH